MSLQSILDQGVGPNTWANLKVQSVDAAHYDGVGLTSGTASLSAGTAIVSNVHCKPTSKVLLTFREAIGGTVGPLFAQPASGEFVAAANNGGTHSFSYLILN